MSSSHRKKNEKNIKDLKYYAKKPNKIYFQRNIDLYISQSNYEYTSDQQFAAFLDQQFDSLCEEFSNNINFDEKSFLHVDDISNFIKCFFLKISPDIPRETILDNDFSELLLKNCFPNQKIDIDRNKKEFKHYISKSKHLWNLLGYGVEYSESFLESHTIYNPTWKEICSIHNFGVFYKIRIVIAYIPTEEKNIKSIQVGDRKARTRVFIAIQKSGDTKNQSYLTLVLPSKNKSVSNLNSNLQDKKSTIVLPDNAPIFYRDKEIKKSVNINFFENTGLDDQNNNKQRNNQNHNDQNKQNKNKQKNNDDRFVIKSLHEFRCILSCDPKYNISRETDQGYIDFGDINNDNNYFLKKYVITKNLQETNQSNYINEYTKYFALAPTKFQTEFSFFEINRDLKMVIYDVYVNNCSNIYIICGYKIDDTRTKLFILEGDIGSQTIDDFYFCKRLEISNFVFASLSPPNQKVNSPSALFISQKSNGKSIYSIEIYSSKDYLYSSNKYEQWILINEKNYFHVPGNLIKGYCIPFSTILFIIAQKNDSRKYILNDYNNFFEDNDDEDPLDSGDVDNMEKHYIFEGNYINQKGKKIVSQKEITKLTISSNDRLMKRTCNMIDSEVKLKIWNPKTELNFISCIEINNKIFLIDIYEQKFYHPARQHFMFKYAIKYLFYQIRNNNTSDFLFQILQPQIHYVKVHASIELQYTGNINNFFHAGSSPCIGFHFLNCDNDYCSKLFVYFFNGNLNSGLDQHRTKCQLAAAYSCASDILMYGPGTRITKFKPENEGYDNWTNEVLLNQVRNMIGTYAALLETRNEYEFNTALHVLPTTKYIVDDFYSFYKNLANEIDPFHFSSFSNQ
ncbi:hypothetical protein TRFO_13279 [Tritrichomonas foetus]|uniref:Uncharacterized protein n=1 Tax=Tritrichomonas foetus TaxID=1144522 RepID=A0A1J4KYN5_9EUKA|nr:hypothetical protein TRFO_13279 [Tritrichomonas foetus]|eukprot:OHT16274.1 hypothetical protein TRFO_13279 [Tritrichomonas foetus]